MVANDYVSYIIIASTACICNGVEPRLIKRLVAAFHSKRDPMCYRVQGRV